MPSYSQYKRQMAVMDADDANIETWITVKGNHIPIMKGQSKEEAVQSFLEKKGKSSGEYKSTLSEKEDPTFKQRTEILEKMKGVERGSKEYKSLSKQYMSLFPKPKPHIERKVSPMNELVGAAMGPERPKGEKPASNSFSKEDIDFVKRNGVTQKYVEYQDEHEGLRNEIVMEERRGRKEDADKIREERKKLEAKMVEEVKRINQIKESLSKSDSPTESERYNRPVHIGEAVRNVVKKMGEQRADSKKKVAGSSTGWPESPKFEKLTEKYMPKTGAADNELGEALRSINQAVYRYYNDGDMYNKGYGKETVNAAIKHLTQLSKNKATPRHIARGIDNGLYELKTYGLKDKGRYETALKILLQTFEFADEKDIDALSKMKRNND